MTRLTKIIFVTALISAGVVGRSEASSITCPTTGTFDRQGTVSNTINCTTMGPTTGTPKESDVEGVFGGDWVGAGILTGNGSDQWLTAAVTGGSWGSLPASGNWSIDPNIWISHPRVALTFHLGNGNGDPDWFFFELAHNATSGTFNFVRLSGGGGGLSNIGLWADPPATGPCVDVNDPTCNTTQAAVPEPASLVLFGSGLAGLAAILRRRSAKRA